MRRMAERRGLLPPEITRRPKFGASIASTWMDSVAGFRSFARDVVLDRGRPEDAVRYYEAAIEHGRRMGSRPIVARLKRSSSSVFCCRAS